VIARGVLVLWCSALSIAFSCGRAQAAHPKTPEGVLAEADHLYDNLDYRGAAELAQAVLESGSAAPKEQARALERIGLCWLVLGQTKLAQEAFDRLFSLEPTREIVEPSLSPRQHDFIERVRAKHPAPEPVVTAPPVVTPPVVAVVAPPPPPARKPLVKRWYFWAPIAAGVVGLALGVGLGLGLPQPSPKGTLGTVGLSLHF
jgi:hypothetical protein